MLNLLLCILTTTALLLVFKLLPRFNIKTYPTIVVNYWVCVACGILLEGQAPPIMEIAGRSWFGLSIFLGFLFILGFNFIGASTRVAGITVTAIANKMSLVVPIAAAFILYNDEVLPLKIAGIIIALSSIILTTIKPQQEDQEKGTFWKKMLLPALVFVSSGIVDTMVNFVQKRHLEGISKDEFLIFLFGTAAVLGTTGLAIRYFTHKETINWKVILAGIALGVPNYGSIYFLMLSLESSNLQSSTVFPLINIGVVSLSTVIAYFAFKEKLTKLNLGGIALAIIAILLLART